MTIDIEALRGLLVCAPSGARLRTHDYVNAAQIIDALPALLDELEAARAENARMREVSEPFGWHYESETDSVFRRHRDALTPKDAQP